METISPSPHPTIKKLFAGRKLVVATMHGKELAMKPLIRQYLNLETVLVPNIDTDEFGTFSGEVERRSDPYQTLRKKIKKGLSETGETLGIGTEGSFVPHPSTPFLQANHEIAMLIDTVNDIEITAETLSTETNHAQQEIRDMKDLLDFAERIQFPLHGMILKQMKEGSVVKMVKGIVTWELLHAASVELSRPDTKLVAASDMRAYLNPTRMKIIERTTQELMSKITNFCPDCHWPGFSMVASQAGLPCDQCGTPTHLTYVKIYQCKHCGYTDERYYAEGMKADPRHCDRCNP